jgi:hypothetical protein
MDGKSPAGLQFVGNLYALGTLACGDAGLMVTPECTGPQANAPAHQQQLARLSMVEACESGQKRATKAEESPNKRQGRMLEYITFEDSGSQASEEEPIAKIHIKNALG